MKRLMAMAIFMIASVSMYGQQYLSTSGEFYYKKYTLNWNLGYTNNDFFIQLKMHEFPLKESLTDLLGDKFIIKTKTGDISLLVTEEVYNKRDMEGFISFSLDSSDIRKLSQSNYHIRLTKAKDDKVFKFREYETGKLGETALLIVRNKIEKPQKVIKKPVYPSWRD